MNGDRSIADEAVCLVESVSGFAIIMELVIDNWKHSESAQAASYCHFFIVLILPGSHCSLHTLVRQM